jgi:glycine/D-amino acid oxidase-like deaminating enzyme
MHATCIATRGYICPPPKDFIQAITCDAPSTITVVEVRPTLRANFEPDAEELVPQVAEANPVAPLVESATDSPSTQDVTPAIAAATPLKPVIVSADEE